MQGEIGKPLAVINEIAPDLGQAIVSGEVGQRQVTLDQLPDLDDLERFLHLAARPNS